MIREGGARCDGREPAVEKVYVNPGPDGSEGMAAVIIRAGYRAEGLTFFSRPDDQQQVGYMKWPAGHVVPAHYHLPVVREVRGTSEILIVKSGLVRLTVYQRDGRAEGSYDLRAGDLVVLLPDWGHGLTFVEESEVLEVKQGPYRPGRDKARILGEGKP